MDNLKSHPMSHTVVFPAKWLKTIWLSNRYFAIWTVSIIAVLVRVAVAVVLKTYAFSSVRDHWQFGYEWARIAKWLVETSVFTLDGSVPTSDTDPLYVFVIAGFFYVFGSYTTTAAIVLIVFQSLLCGLGAWAIFVLAEKCYGPIEARISSLLFAFYPASIFFAVGRIGPSSLETLLLCLIFTSLLVLQETRQLRFGVLGGILLGLMILTSSKILSLVIVIPIWFFLMNKRQAKRSILTSMIVLGAAFLVVLPWSVRNSRVLEGASLSKANLGYHLWVGNNPKATGYYYTTDIPDRELSSAERRSPYFQMAISWMAHHPKEFVLLTFKRMQYFWHAIPRENIRAKDSVQTWIFMAVCGLSLVGLLRPEKTPGVWLLLLYVLFFPIVFYVTHVTFYRHRFHIEPFMLIFAAAGMRYLWVRCNSLLTCRPFVEKRA